MPLREFRDTAAAGGLGLLAALAFLGLVPDEEGREGWGIPMATDIAFAVGCSPGWRWGCWCQPVRWSGTCQTRFAVSLFIASLAYPTPALQDQARVGVLAASLVAAGLGARLLHRCLPPTGQARWRPRGGPVTRAHELAIAYPRLSANAPAAEVARLLAEEPVASPPPR